jgi:hypothetical protein
MISVNVDETNSGGTPSSPFFYKNPQYLIKVDYYKAITKPIELKILYESEGNPDNCINIFVTKPNHNKRVLSITPEIKVSQSKVNSHTAS